MNPYGHVMTWCKGTGVTSRSSSIAADGKAVEFRKFMEMSLMLSNAQKKQPLTSCAGGRAARGSAWPSCTRSCLGDVPTMDPVPHPLPQQDSGGSLSKHVEAPCNY